MKNERPIDNKEILNIEDKIEEKIFMGLRMNEGINFDDFKKQFNIDFLERYHKQIKDLSDKHLIRISEENIALTQKGREISNTVFIEFMN